MQGLCFKKKFLMILSWHKKIGLLIIVKLAPACLRTILGGLDTEHRLLTAVLLALDASWLTSSSLDIRGYRLTLDNRELCSHACYSWVQYLRLFVALCCACFVALPRLVIYPRRLCVHACFVALPRLVIFPRGLCVHACDFVLWKVL